MIGKRPNNYKRAPVLKLDDPRRRLACSTCGGRGEIGGWVGQTAESGGYETEPCPECCPKASQTRPADASEAEPQAMRTTPNSAEASQ